MADQSAECWSVSQGRAEDTTFSSSDARSRIPRFTPQALKKNRVGSISKLERFEENNGALSVRLTNVDRNFSSRRCQIREKFPENGCDHVQCWSTMLPSISEIMNTKIALQSCLYLHVYGV
jgi:hypothetical protein